jgi:siroheme synthase-like protein
MLKLEGRKCVMVGAGRVASAKVMGLLKHRAHVIVVSPQAVNRIRVLARAHRLVWRRRAFSARDLAGACLVVAATDSSRVNKSVFRACRARGILCNVVDDPEHCDFFYPAVVGRGALQIAISTGGRSPALAAQLRRELEKQFGPEWGDWVEHAGRARRMLLDASMPAEERRKQLLAAVSPRAFRAFLRDTDQNALGRSIPAGKKLAKSSRRSR